MEPHIASLQPVVQQELREAFGSNTAQAHPMRYLRSQQPTVPEVRTHVANARSGAGKSTSGAAARGPAAGARAQVLRREVLFADDVLTGLSDGNWKTRFAAVKSFQSTVLSLSPNDTNAQILFRTLNRKPGLKDANVQVLKARLEVVKYIAETFPISTTVADFVIHDIVNKLGEGKCINISMDCLTCLSEASGLEHVANEGLSFAMNQQRNPKVQSELFNWLAAAVKEFGFTMNVKPFIAHSKRAIAATNRNVRSSAVNFIGVLSLYVGPSIINHFDSEKAATKRLIRSELDKYANSSPPTPTRQVTKPGSKSVVQAAQDKARPNLPAQPLPAKPKTTFRPYISYPVCHGDILQFGDVVPMTQDMIVPETPVAARNYCKNVTIIPETPDDDDDDDKITDMDLSFLEERIKRAGKTRSAEHRRPTLVPLTATVKPLMRQQDANDEQESRGLESPGADHDEPQQAPQPPPPVIAPLSPSRHALPTSLPPEAAVDDSQLTDIIHSISSPDLNSALRAMSLINGALRKGRGPDLAPYEEGLVRAVTGQISRLRLGSRAPRQAISAYRYIGTLLNTCALTSDPDADTLMPVLQDACVCLLEHSARTAVLCALISLLQCSIGVVDPFHPRYQDLLLKCFRKPLKMINTWDLDSIDYDWVLFKIHLFYKAYPKFYWTKTSNTPYKTVNTLVHTLVKMKGTSITNHLTQIPYVQESDLYSYLLEVFKQLKLEDKPSDAMNGGGVGVGAAVPSGGAAAAALPRPVHDHAHDALSQLYDLRLEGPSVWCAGAESAGGDPIFFQGVTFADADAATNSNCEEFV